MQVVARLSSIVDDLLRASEDGDRKPHDLPEGLQRHTFLMWDFHKRFLPHIASAFIADPDLQIAFWAEDDIKFSSSVTMTKIVKACGANPAPLTWLAYRTVARKARFGAHLVAVHRNGVQQLMDYMDEYEAEQEAAGRDYLMGLDTFLYHMTQSMPALDQGLLKVACKSWASQRTHDKKGRR